MVSGLSPPHARDLAPFLLLLSCCCSEQFESQGSVEGPQSGHSDVTIQRDLCWTCGVSRLSPFRGMAA